MEGKWGFGLGGVWWGGLSRNGGDCGVLESVGFFVVVLVVGGGGEKMGGAA